jgi:hypothetical protein
VKPFPAIVIGLGLILATINVQAGTREPTEISFFLSTFIESVSVNGDLEPDLFEEDVRVTFFKRVDGEWARRGRMTAVRDDYGTSGDFGASFPMLKRGRCKITARFAGNETYLPAKASQTYRCSGEGLAGPV